MKNKKVSYRIETIFVILAAAFFQIIPEDVFAATVTSFNTITPASLVLDSKDNLYTTNTYANTISKITPAGNVSIFASVGNWPWALTVDKADNIYVANYSGGSGETSATISKITPSGLVTTFATVGPYPIAIIFDAAGNLYTTSTNAGNTVGSIYKVTPAGVVSYFASVGISPVALVFDKTGNLYAADNNWGGAAYLNSVYKITPSGVVSVFAKVDTYPVALAFDSKGNLYTANNYSDNISKITPSGIVTKFTSILSPEGIAFDNADNFYASSYGAGYTNPGVITKVTPAGVSSVVAKIGNGEFTDIIFDSVGNLFSTNYGNSGIKKIASDISVSSNIATSWSIAGPASFTGSGISQLSLSNKPGIYTITWGVLPGYKTPASQSFTLDSLGSISFNGIYSNSLNCGIAQDADGNIYNTVLVGTQCWMASNLKVGTKILGGYAPASFATPANNGVIEKFCYNNDDAICAAEGGLYAWDEAMQYSSTPGAQGICPADWHIPTDEEQYTLENYLKDPTELCNANSTGVSCYNAASKMMQNGSSGMNFPLAGLYYTNGVFSNHLSGAFITSSSDNVGLPWDRHLMSGLGGVHRFGLSRGTGISVRCVKTAPLLNLNVSAGQGVTINSVTPDASINCNSGTGTCLKAYMAGTNVTLKASVSSPNVFTGWSDACTGLNPNSCTILMDGDKNVSATATCTPNPVQPLADTTCRKETYFNGCGNVFGNLDCTTRSTNKWKEVAP